MIYFALWRVRCLQTSSLNCHFWFGQQRSCSNQSVSWRLATGPPKYKLQHLMMQGGKISIGWLQLFEVISRRWHVLLLGMIGCCKGIRLCSWNPTGSYLFFGMCLMMALLFTTFGLVLHGKLGHPIIWKLFFTGSHCDLRKGVQKCDSAWQCLVWYVVLLGTSFQWPFGWQCLALFRWFLFVAQDVLFRGPFNFAQWWL